MATRRSTRSKSRTERHISRTPSPVQDAESSDQEETLSQYDTTTGCNNDLEYYILRMRELEAEVAAEKESSSLVPLEEHEELMNELREKLTDQMDSIRADKDDLSLKRAELERQLAREIGARALLDKEKIELEKERDELIKEVLDLSTGLRDAESTTEDLQFELEKLRKELERVNTSEATLREQYEELGSRSTELSGEVGVLEVKLQASQDDYNTETRYLNAEIDRLKEELTVAANADELVMKVRQQFAMDSRNEIEQKRVEIENARDDALQLQKDEFDEAIEAQRRENDELHASRELLRVENTQLQRDAIDAQAERDEFEQKYNSGMESVKRLTEQLEEIKSRPTVLHSDDAEVLALKKRLRGVEDQMAYLSQHYIPLQQAYSV